MAFILAFIIIALLFINMPRILMWYIRYKAQKSMKQKFGDIFDDAQRGPQPGSNHRTNNNHGTTPSKKVFTSEDGEYVEFEEIEVTETTVTEHYTGPAEQQVSDAEWEDVK